MMRPDPKKQIPKIAFFGTPQFAVTVLNELKKAGLVPALVITAPDQPQGRGLVLTAPPVKVWANENRIDLIQPSSLKADLKDGSAASSLLARLFNGPWDLFIVAAYGKILPENILNIPKYKTLNVHPSLLPKWRGPSPIESSILNDDREVGVTIMRLDQEMDHGPIIAQEKVEEVVSWPLPAPELENILAHIGGALLAKTIPAWLTGQIAEKEQDHALATYCKKINKTDGLIDLTGEPYQNYLKICAYSGWPGTYFFQERKGKDGLKKIRVTIKKASFKDERLEILTVVPEGRSEMPYLDFRRGIK